MSWSLRNNWMFLWKYIWNHHCVQTWEPVSDDRQSGDFLRCSVPAELDSHGPMWLTTVCWATGRPGGPASQRRMHEDLRIWPWYICGRVCHQRSGHMEGLLCWRKRNKKTFTYWATGIREASDSPGVGAWHVLDWRTKGLKDRKIEGQKEGRTEGLKDWKTKG